MKEDIIFLRCKRCNRPLKDDISRKRGYGNKCWRLYHIELEAQKEQNTIFKILDRMYNKENNSEI